MGARSNPCPICASSSAGTVHASTIPEGDDDPAPYFGSFRAKTGYYAIVRCSGCGLVRMDPRDDDETLARAYGSLPADAAGVLDEATRRIAASQARYVARLVPAPARLVDVGSGAGAFLDVASAGGYQVTGIEPAEACVARIAERLPHVRMVCGWIERASLEAGSADAVTLWDVLEHLGDPRAAVGTLASWVAPRGWLFLQVPNGASLAARVLGPRWPLYLREHLWYFDARSLRRLLDEAGFEVIDVSPCLRWFPLGHLAERFAQLGVGASLAPRARALASRLVLAGPAGEMRIAARKRR
jgi:2-polyprenyl-3-methyl-5-hydroxy-6-metoxy-1,4-benzoquinol methylase